MPPADASVRGWLNAAFVPVPSVAAKAPLPSHPETAPVATTSLRTRLFPKSDTASHEFVGSNCVSRGESNIAFVPIPPEIPAVFDLPARTVPLAELFKLKTFTCCVPASAM